MFSNDMLGNEITTTEDGVELVDSMLSTIDSDEPISLAESKGWKPLEEWDGNPEDWVDYKEFNRRGEYIDRIKSESSQKKALAKRLAAVEATSRDLSEHLQKVKEVEYKNALADLKETRKLAMELGDVEEAFEVDEQIRELKDAKKNEPAPEKIDPNQAQVEAWIEENSWYKKDVVLRGAADAIAMELVKTDPSLNKDVGALLERVMETLQEEFPNRNFGNTPTKTKSTPTKNLVIEPGEGNVRAKADANTSRRYTARSLNSEQLRIAKSFVDMGAVKSVDEYAAQLAAIGEI